MPRLCTSVALAMFSLCVNLAFGQVSNKRIDSRSQELNYLEGGAFAADYSNPSGNMSSFFKRLVSSNTYASYNAIRTASSGTSSATVSCEFLAWTPFATGSLGVEVPQVEVSIGVIETVHASSTDPYAKAISTVIFDPCRATGRYEVTGPANQTADFTGEMEIIVHTVTGGDAGMEGGRWRIICGPSDLEGVRDGAQWRVNGVIVESGVPQYVVNEFWPLELNELIFTDHVAEVGEEYDVEVSATDFGFQARAGYMSSSQSDLIGEVVLGSSYRLD